MHNSGKLIHLALFMASGSVAGSLASNSINTGKAAADYYSWWRCPCSLSHVFTHTLNGFSWAFIPKVVLSVEFTSYAVELGNSFDCCHNMWLLLQLWWCGFLSLCQNIVMKHFLVPVKLVVVRENLTDLVCTFSWCIWSCTLASLLASTYWYAC